MSEEEDYRKYSRKEIKEEMAKLDGWKLVKGKLHREIDFESFEDAMSFMGRAAMEVAKLDHHPEWFNVYNTVRIDLITHDVNGLSNYDFRLARILNGLLTKYRQKRKR